MRNLNAEIVKDEIKSGLGQVDDTLVLDSFSCHYDSAARKLIVKFSTSNEAGESVAVSLEY